MALTLEDVDEIIDKAKPELLKRLNFDTLLQAELRRLDVITESHEDQLKAPSLTPHNKIDILLEGLKAGPIERFLFFCRTIHTEGRGHLLLSMGLNIRDIETQINTVYDDAEAKGSHQQAIRRSNSYQPLLFDEPDLALPEPQTDRREQHTEQDQVDRYPVILQKTEASIRCNLKINAPYELLLLTDTIDLVKNDTSILTWKYVHIRQYGLGEHHFMLEAGRSCQSGAGMFRFNTEQSKQLYDRVLMKRKIFNR